MRLLMITADWAPIEGGIATLCHGIAGSLAARGHAVEVLAPARPGADRQAEEAAGLCVRRWPGYSLGPARWLPLALASRPSLARAEAVLAMNPAYGGAIAWLAHQIGRPLPYLVWAYGYELLKARGTPLGPLYRRIFARARAAVAISRYTAGLLEGLGVEPGHIAILPPGVDPPAPPPSDRAPLSGSLAIPPGRMVLTVARLVERKGHLALLEGLALAARRHPDLCWVVVGRGPLRARLEQRASELGLAARVRFLGYVPDPTLDQLYREASLFALTPRDLAGDAEGFGIVFLEAGARGLPVVASRVGGVPEAVAEGISGLLVEPDDPAAVAAAIDRLLSDRPLALRLGQGGREHAGRRSWANTAESIEALLAGPGR